MRAARQRWVLTEGMPSETRRRRLYAWLERRGHRPQKIIETLEAKDQQREWDEEAERESEEEENY